MLSSFFVRILVLLGNFLLVALVSRIWGAEGKGEITLFLADAVLISMFFQLVSGASVSYCSRKSTESQVLYHAYFWSVVVCMPLVGLFRVCFFPSEVSGFFLAFVLMDSLFLIHQSMLIAQREFRLYHTFCIVQVYVPLLVFSVLYFWGIEIEISFYFLTYILNLLLMIFVGLMIFGKRIKWEKFALRLEIWREMLHYGWRAQESVLLTFFRQRFSYYFIGSFFSLSSLGVYSVAVSISEAILAVSKSIAIVLYGEVLNSPRPLHQKELLKNTLRLVSFLTMLMGLGLILLPSSFYTMIFGAEFSSVKSLVLVLLPGVFLDALGNVFAYYYSGINHLRNNTVRALVGFVLVGILCYVFTPFFGILGTALATSVAYGMSSLWLFFVFYRENSFSGNHFFLSQKQWCGMKNFILNKISRKDNRNGRKNERR